VRRRLKVVVLLVIVAATVLAIRHAATRLAIYRRTERACAAVDDQDWKTALDASTGDLPPTVAGLRASDCRCMALLYSGRGQECVALLERQLAAPAARDWLPRPALTTLVVEARHQKGDLPGALHLASAGADGAPQFLPLLLRETQLRLQLQDRAEAVRATRARLEHAGPGETSLRLFLADQVMAQQGWEEAVEALGEQAPPEPARDLWFDLRLQALVRLGRIDAALATVRDWERSGGNPDLARATYAFLLSITQQQDAAGRPILDLLREAVTAGDRIGDPELLKSCYRRYVGTLVVAGQREEALRRFDEAVARFGSFTAFDRDDLLSNAARTGEPETTIGARLRFDVPGSQAGDRLLLSPAPDQPHDAPFGEHRLVPGAPLLVEARAGTWPVRWVLRDGNGAVRGSGSVWPAAGSRSAEPTVVKVRRGAPTPAAPDRPLSTRPAAGRRRLVVVILDCADWRFVRHGLARGELPTFAALTASGAQGVLLSRPPFTAVAVHAIASPGKQRVDGVFGVLHQLGAEIAGLNFVGSNPLSALGWVLPGAADLFTTLGAGDLRTANLLHSYGGLAVGRHGELVGPRGKRGTVPLGSGRPLRQDEQALIGPMDEDTAFLLAEMAADFDNASRLAASGDTDLVLLRVASLDLLTHTHFAATARGGQDDGAPLLFRIYRYVDRRVGDVYAVLDGNDVLVVMSDHGIRTAFQHDEQALFVAAGAEVPAGRFAGSPDLRGVPRMIADFFGVATTWPSSGVEGWLDPADRPAAAPGRVP
jgi:hypothetical protein